MVLLIICVALVVLWLATGMLLSAPTHSGRKSAHFDGKKFINPDNIRARGLWSVLKWLATRKRERWTYRSDAVPGPPPPPGASDLRITFVNHSTFLIQLDNYNILTDPIWSERASPFSWAGPHRMRPPGIRFDDLPHIHAVLLSHNHYDHLDINTVRRLVQAYDPLFIVPLGVGSYLRQSNITKIEELDWWQEINLFDGVGVLSVPAIHFSGRGTFDRDGTLWCGYVVKGSRRNIYFAGDTGYHEPTFRSIGDACSVDVAIVPIGAYSPRWFMAPIHCSPDEAVQIHLDVRAKVSVASHFGTFPLADESQTQPEEHLRLALQERNVASSSFLVIEPGVAVDLE